MTQQEPERFISRQGSQSVLPGQILVSTDNSTSTAFSSNVYLGDLALFLMIYIQTFTTGVVILFSLLFLNSVYVDYCIYESMWLISKP